MKNSFSKIVDIYIFTLTQSIKTKSFKIVMAVFFFVAFAGIFFAQYLSSNNDDVVKVEKIVVVDDLSLFDSYEEIIKESSEYKYVKLIKSKDIDTAIKELKELKEDNKVAVIHLTKVDEVMTAIGYYSENSLINEVQTIDISNYFASNLRKAIIKTKDVNKEMMDLLNNRVDSEVVFLDEAANMETGNLDSQNDVKDTKPLIDNSNTLVYVSLFVIMIILSFSGGAIAESIISEKSNKVIEYIVINVDPKNIVIGKVLAKFTLVFLNVIALLAGIITGILVTYNKSSFINNLFAENIFEDVKIVNVVIAIVAFSTGLLMYGFIAALAGSSVNKIEELAEGVKVFTYILIISAYLGMAVINISLDKPELDSLSIFALLFPFSSPMLLPGYAAFGKISTLFAFSSTLILILFTILILNITTRVYKNTIFYNGNPLGIKKLLSFRKIK